MHRCIRVVYAWQHFCFLSPINAALGGVQQDGGVAGQSMNRNINTQLQFCRKIWHYPGSHKNHSARTIWGQERIAQARVESANTAAPGVAFDDDHDLWMGPGDQVLVKCPSRVISYVRCPRTCAKRLHANCLSNGPQPGQCRGWWSGGVHVA